MPELTAEELKALTAEISHRVIGEIMNSTKEKGFGNSSALSISLNTAAYTMALAVEQIIVASQQVKFDEDASLKRIHTTADFFAKIAHGAINAYLPQKLKIVELGAGESFSTDL